VPAKEIFDKMKILSLNGSWHLTRVATRETIAAEVPGCVHTDLLAAGVIEDPFYRDNEASLQWISDEEWLYERTFAADELQEFDRVLLRCEGLDTIAAISLNGVAVGSADNMFRTWEFDIKAALKTGRNQLSILFKSPIKYIEACAKDQRPLPGWAGPNETKLRPWIRKAPYSFGWDWGPVLATSGIWRPIEIVAFNTARITDMLVQQDHSNFKQGIVSLDIDVSAEVCPNAAPLEVLGRVLYRNGTIADCRTALVNGKARLHLDIRNAQLWWPAGLGDQPLYEVNIDLQQERNTIHRTSRRMGMRILKLERKKDEYGETFQFVINGIPIFAKGANWIPADALLPRLSRVEYARLVKAAVVANMNMLRVWGGGIYESDAFYDLYDEYGICVWQDFMFACATYPTFDHAWLDNVRTEIAQNVSRLRHHPCLALWCGNNELEQGLVGDEWSNHQMSWPDYSTLFDKLIPEVLQQTDPQRDYWPGSPHTPAPGQRQNFNDPDRGDAHLWSVWHGRQPFEWYRTSHHRFCSEFGFQSFMEPRGVATYTAPEDRNITSYVMEHHQRSAIGNTVIMQYMLDWYRMPYGFENTLWLSQIQQGMSMKYAVEHWRRNRPRCMGALYWQLNDCWPVASWSSLDYHGRWKALHYMGRRFYAPLLISGVEDTEKGTVEIHTANDTLKTFKGSVGWRATRLDGTLLRNETIPVEIAPNSTSLVTTADIADLVTKYGPRDIIVWMTLLDHEETALSWNIVTFARPKHLELKPPAYKMELRAWDDNSYAITFTAKVPVLWLWVSLKNMEAKFDDNFICLEPDRPMRIRITPAQRMKLEEFREAVQIRSLWHTYREPGAVPPPPPKPTDSRSTMLAKRVAVIEAAAKKTAKKATPRKPRSR